MISLLRLLFLHGAIFLNIFYKVFGAVLSCYICRLFTLYICSFFVTLCVAVIVYAAKFYENKISFVCTYLVYKLL